MQELDDNKLDALMRGHAKRQLDPLVGLAAPAVLRWNFQNPAHGARKSWKKSATVAAAACLLGLVLAGGAYFAFQSNRSSGVMADGPVTTIQWSETYDAGTIMVNDQTPARLFERLQFEKTSTTLPDGSVKVKTIVPRRDLILVEYPTQ